MDNPFLKPWHGVERADIDWHPSIDETICLGCGLCVTGCSRKVYRYDYEKKRPVVTVPIYCMVACTTCANACPAHAISFPPLSRVHHLIKEHGLLKQAREEINARRQEFETAG